jgi:drug/metabolite transporter (DMT)-like permease
MASRGVPLKSASLVILSGILWGTVAVIVRVLVQSMDAGLIAFVRILLAGAAITLVLYAREGLAGLRPHWRLVVPAAIGIALNYLLFTLGLKYTLASAGAMVVQSEVVFLAALSVLAGEAFGTRKGLGMALAMGGVFLITWNGESLGELFASEYFLGNIIVMVAGFFWAVYVFCQRRMARGPGILVHLSPIFLLAALFLLPFSIDSLPSLMALDAIQLLALLYLGIVCTGLGYILLAEAMKSISASGAGVLTTVMPMTSVCLSAIFLNEVLTTFIIVGACLDISGVILVVRSEGSPS